MKEEDDLIDTSNNIINKNCNTIINEEKNNNLNSIKLLEQKDFNDIFEPLKIEEDDYDLSEISFQKINNEYTNKLSELYKTIDLYNKTQNNNLEHPFFKIQNTCKYIPKLNIESKILNKKQI